MTPLGRQGPPGRPLALAPEAAQAGGRGRGWDPTLTAAAAQRLPPAGGWGRGPGPGYGRQERAEQLWPHFLTPPAWPDAGGSCWDVGGAQLHQRPPRAPSRAVWVGCERHPSSCLCLRALSSYPGDAPNRGLHPPFAIPTWELRVILLARPGPPPPSLAPSPGSQTLSCPPSHGRGKFSLRSISVLPSPLTPPQHSDEPNPTRPRPRPVLGPLPHPEVLAQEWNLPHEEEPKGQRGPLQRTGPGPAHQLFSSRHPCPAQAPRQGSLGSRSCPRGQHKVNCTFCTSARDCT